MLSTAPPPAPPPLQVIPPKGYLPRKAKVDLDKIRIGTPIKQHVFGKSGAYVCILEEQRVREGRGGLAGWRGVPVRRLRQPARGGRRQQEERCERVPLALPSLPLMPTLPLLAAAATPAGHVGGGFQAAV